MSAVHVTLTEIKADMKQLNRLTAEVRDNTGEMVTISKSLKLLGRIATWGGAISTLVAAIYATRFLPTVG
jgi:hypothetical protein